MSNAKSQLFEFLYEQRIRVPVDRESVAQVKAGWLRLAFKEAPLFPAILEVADMSPSLQVMQTGSPANANVPA